MNSAAVPCVAGSQIISSAGPFTFPSNAANCVSASIYLLGSGGNASAGTTTAAGAGGAGGNWVQLAGITDTRIFGATLTITMGATVQVTDNKGVITGNLIAEAGGSASGTTNGAGVVPAANASATGATLTAFRGGPGGAAQPHHWRR